MRLLVGGCSFSSGWGFAPNNMHQNWPNQLATKLGAELTNVSVYGYDNQGIFINFIEQLIVSDFDLCLFQVTALDRVVISPNVHSHRLIGQYNISNGFLTDSEYRDWHKKFVLLNQGIEHWNRFIKIVSIVQELSKQGKKIKFVNGLLTWDRELFTQPTKSNFIKSVIDFDNIIDNDVDKFTKIVYNQAQLIDLDLWVNPFDPFCDLKVDVISNEDTHPGLRSQQVFANLIYKDIANA